MTDTVIALAEAHSKVCLGCAKNLPLSAFRKKAASKDGHGPRCVICQRVCDAERRKTHPEEIRKHRFEWRRKHPKYALEWQHKNRERHAEANRKYVNKKLLEVKPAEGETKICIGCSRTLPLSCFWRYTKLTDGRHSKCADCKLTEKRRRFYGLSDERFEAMWVEQNGGCAICDKPLRGEHKNSFVVDHDHASGLHRGLLCAQCNVGIGNLKDDAVICDKAASYLRKHKRVVSGS